MNIRQAVTADAQRIGEVHVLYWRTGIGDYIDAAYLESLNARDVTMQWLRSLASPIHADTLVAEEDGGIVGFIDFGINRNELGFHVAEVYGLYVDPDSWNQGIDTGLLEAAELHLAETGFRTVIVWILSLNQDRCRFYEAHGWVRDDVDDYHHSGAPVTRYSRQL